MLPSAHLSLDEGRGSNGLLQRLDLLHGSSDHGRPGVHDGLTAILAQGQLFADCHATHTERGQCLSQKVCGSGGWRGGRFSPVHVDLPVGLAGDVEVGEVAAVVFGVGSSEQQLTAGLLIRVPDTSDVRAVSVGQSRSNPAPYRNILQLRLLD